MWFLCQGREGGGDFEQIGLDIGCCGAVLVGVVAGVGAGDGVAEGSFNPGERGVA